MTALDIMVMLLMGGGAIFGFLRGFVQETLSLFAWFLVIFAVRFLHAPATAFLTEPVGTSSGAAVLAFFAVAAITYAAGRWIARSVGKRTRKSVLGPVDRVLGFGFGLVKGLVIASLAYLLFALVYDSLFGVKAARPEWLAQSRSYPLLNASGNAIADIARRNREAAGAQGTGG